MISRHHIEQRTPEWFALRCGRLTASKFKLIMGKPSATRTKYFRQTAGEYVTQVVREGYTSASMQRGIDCEPQALAMYQFETDLPVIDGAFYTRQDLPMCGCSPDGIVGTEGVLEIKVPEMDTHIGYLEKPDKVPTEYYWQVIGHLLFTGAEWVDFYSFSPEGLTNVLVHTQRDDVREDMDKLFGKLQEAEHELTAIIERIKNG